MEAGDLSLMLRKSVEARDWLATLEPRTVRAVMKRVIEDVTLIGENQCCGSMTFWDGSGSADPSR